MYAIKIVFVLKKAKLILIIKFDCKFKVKKKM